MAEWRERGYVPDSDDEEEYDIQIQPSQWSSREKPNVPDDRPELGLVIRREGAGQILAAHAKEDTSRSSSTVAEDARPPSWSNSLKFSTSIALSVPEVNSQETQNGLCHFPTTSESKGIRPSRTNSPVAEQLKAVLDLGLQQIGDILGTPTRPEGLHDVDNSLSSSPLSSLGSVADITDWLDNGENLRSSYDKSQQSLLIEKRPLLQTLHTPFAPRRELRHRNPIQLHPYALEDARYQQELKARGLKPVRVGNSGMNVTHVTNQTKRDNASVFSSSPFEESGPVVDSLSVVDENIDEGESLDFAGDEEMWLPSQQGDDDDELPDIAAILRGDKSVSHSKLSKTTQRPQAGKVSRLRTMNEPFDVYDFPEIHEATTYDNLSGEARFIVPPSPPRSVTPMSVYEPPAAEKEATYAEATPGYLPTPLISSEVHSRKRSIVELLDSSQEQLQLELADRAPSSFPSSESDLEKARRIKQMRRKMKGVLPASWLKLDLNKQTAVGASQLSPGLPLGLTGSKGVAQRISFKKHRAPESETLPGSRDQFSDLDISDDAGSSSNEEAFPTENRQHAFEDDGPGYWLGDVVEDNRIDVMAPSGTRRRTSTTKMARKRQQRISNTWGKVATILKEASKSSKGSFSGPTYSVHRRHPTKRNHKRRKKEPSLPKLTVLDAPGFVQLATQQQPKFLRVAGRMAQTKARPVPQDPTQKFFRLETDKDTLDINDNLIQWRAGRLEQRQRAHQALEIDASAALPRPSVHSAPAVQRTIPNGSSELSGTQTNDVNDLSALKSTTNSTIRRILFRQRGLAGLPQNEGFHFSENRQNSTPTSRCRLTVNPRSSLQNRSGQGKFQRAAAGPRLAQLEKIKPIHASSNFAEGLENAFPAETNLDFLTPDTLTLPGIETEQTLPLLGIHDLHRGPVRRFPRKRIPKFRAARYESDVPRIDLIPKVTPSTVQEQLPEDIQLIRAALDDIAHMKHLVSGFAYEKSTPIGSGTLRKIQDALVFRTLHTDETCDTAISQARNLDRPTFMVRNISHPETSEPILCTRWTDELATKLTSAFESIPCLLEVLSAYTEDPISAPTLKSQTKRVISFLDQIVEFQYQSLYFEKPEHRQQYVLTSSIIIEKFSRTVAVWCDMKSELAAFNIQHVLNRMVLYAFEVAVIASEPGITSQMQKKSREMFKVASADALRFALRQINEEGKPTWLQFRRIDPSELRKIGMGYPEIDAIVIVYILSSSGIMHDESANCFNEILAIYLQPDYDDDKPVLKLVGVISALSKTLPFTEIDIDGKRVRAPPAEQGSMSNFWNLVTPPLTRWLRQYVRNENSRTVSDMRLGKAIFGWCYDLANEWLVSFVPDELVKTMHWAYVNNNMRELFGDPHVERTSDLRVFDLEDIPGREGRDTDFELFCKLLAKCLQAKRRANPDLSDIRVEDRLRSFVNRLCPNTGPPLLESDDVRVADLSLLWNRCTLYAVLFSCSLDSIGPRLSQIREVVDFSTSHMEACLVMLRLWETLAPYAMTTVSRLTELADWMYDMLNRMISKWQRAKTQVLNQLAVFGRIPDQRALNIIAANQKVVAEFLIKALKSWERILVQSETITQSVALLGVHRESFEPLIRSFTQTFASDDSMMAHLTYIFDFFLNKWTTRTPVHLLRVVHSTLKGLLSNHLSADPSHQTYSLFMIQLTDSWFKYADVAVKAEINTWDDFLDPAGCCAWELFGDFERSAPYQVLFVSNILANASDEYEGKKLWFLKYWLTALLQPFPEWKYQDCLTSALLQKDVYNNLLFNLPQIMPNNENKYTLSLEELMSLRSEVLIQIVENIGKHDEDDSQADLYALQRDDLIELLKAMMNTMIACHRQLGQIPTEQRQYDNMINRVVETMARRTSKLCKVDSWFTDDKEFQSGRLAQLARLAGDGHQGMGELVISKQDVIWFHITSQKAAVEATQAVLAGNLKKVYANAGFKEAWETKNGMDMSKEEQNSVVKQVAMMQQIFPAYIELALTDAGGLIAAPVLESLPEICRHLVPFATTTLVDGAVIIEEVNWAPVLEGLYAIIVASCACLETTQPPYIWISCSRMKAFANVLSISRLALLQYFQICNLPGPHRDHANILDAFEYARFLHLYACHVGSRPPLNPAFDEATILEGMSSTFSARAQPTLSNPEAEAIKAYARKELHDALKGLWTMDANGQFWVQSQLGREPFRVTGDPLKGLEDAEILEMVLREVQLFTSMYVGLEPGLILNDGGDTMMDVLTM